MDKEGSIHSGQPSISSLSSKIVHSFADRVAPVSSSLKESYGELLELDIAHMDCIRQLCASQKMLMRKNLSRSEIDEILDKTESEILLAQHIALWKRDVLISTDGRMYKLTGRKSKPKLEKPVVVKAKVRTKKTAAAAVKENIRRSEREHRSPCTAKCKEKDQPSTTSTTPENNGSTTNPLRTKRKGKDGDSVAESSCPSSKKRTSGRLAKPSRKKQVVAAPIPQAPATAEEPTYCLCEQISFGEMIGCDNEKCDIEWFHFECVQLKVKPKGKWYCPLCRGERTNILKSSLAK